MNRFCTIPAPSNVDSGGNTIDSRINIVNRKPAPPVAFRGSPSVSLGFRPPSGGREEPKSEARRAENARLRQRVFVRCARPKGLRAPWNPGRGPPLHRTPISAFRRPCREPSRRGAGVPGKSAPDTLPAGLGRSGRVKGPCPRPLRGCGPHQPLDPPSTRKTRHRPAQGLEGHCRSGWGQGSRSDTAQRLGLDAQERPQRQGRRLGVLFPQPPATWRTAPGGPPEALLPLIFASEVWGFRGAARPLNQVTKEPTKRSAGRALCVSWL